MPDAELKARYLAYLDALNDRRFQDLDNYVRDELIYNGQALTREQYAEMIAEVWSLIDRDAVAKQLRGGP